MDKPDPLYDKSSDWLYWSEIQHKLELPFDPKHISWRVGSTTQDKSKGMALAYVDARVVMRRLDKVCGGLWQCRYPLSDSGLLICEIGIKIEDDWIWRANGAGDTHVEAEKGKASDAFKRAAVMWGIGRYLYAIKSPWVPLDQYKRLSETPALPAWATPEGFDEIMKKREAK